MDKLIQVHFYTLHQSTTFHNNIIGLSYTHKKMVCEKLKAEISCYQGNQSLLSFKSFYHWYNKLSFKINTTINYKI